MVTCFKLMKPSFLIFHLGSTVMGHLVILFLTQRNQNNLKNSKRGRKEKGWEGGRRRERKEGRKKKEASKKRGRKREEGAKRV